MFGAFKTPDNPEAHCAAPLVPLSLPQALGLRQALASALLPDLGLLNLTQRLATKASGWLWAEGLPRQGSHCSHGYHWRYHFSLPATLDIIHILFVNRYWFSSTNNVLGSVINAGHVQFLHSWSFYSGGIQRTGLSILKKKIGNASPSRQEEWQGVACWHSSLV